MSEEITAWNNTFLVHMCLYTAATVSVYHSIYLYCKNTIYHIHRPNFKLPFLILQVHFGTYTTDWTYKGVMHPFSVPVAISVSILCSRAPSLLMLIRGDFPASFGCALIEVSLILRPIVLLVIGQVVKKIWFPPSVVLLSLFSCYQYDL